MSAQPAPVLHGQVTFVCRFRVSGTDTLANRLFTEWTAMGLFPNERGGEALVLARVIANTIKIIFNLAPDASAELVAFKQYWEWIDSVFVIARRPNGAPAEFSQEPEHLRALWEGYNDAVGIVAGNHWFDAYDRQQATYAPAPARTILAPEMLTAEELADPNLQPPASNTGTG